MSKRELELLVSVIRKSVQLGDRITVNKFSSRSRSRLESPSDTVTHLLAYVSRTRLVFSTHGKFAEFKRVK